VSRAVIDKIGVFDTRFYGYMADIDYGVRARRAGFRNVIAAGAWLHHEGGGSAKATAEQGGPPLSELGREMVEYVHAAYEQFRLKWPADLLPASFRDMKAHHFDALHALPPMAGDAFVPPLTLSDDVGDL